MATQAALHKDLKWRVFLPETVFTVVGAITLLMFAILKCKLSLSSLTEIQGSECVEEKAYITCVFSDVTFVIICV